MTPEEIRSFEESHSPDGWPAIRMRDISALLDEVDKKHDHYKRILWNVCKNYGTAGECVFAGFKAALEKEAK